jgi:hypothetical protein
MLRKRVKEVKLEADESMAGLVSDGKTSGFGRVNWWDLPLFILLSGLRLYVLTSHSIRILDGTSKE